MKLRPNATLDDVKHVCNELAGSAGIAKRFAGLCHTRLDLVGSTHSVQRSHTHSIAALPARRMWILLHAWRHLKVSH